MIGIESIALLLDYLFIALNVTYYFINIVSSLICSYLLSTFLVFVVCDYCIVIMYAIFVDTYYMYLFFMSVAIRGKLIVCLFDIVCKRM